MGIFDFFRRQAKTLKIPDKKCIECGSVIIGNHKICYSCTPEAKIAAAKAKKSSKSKKKLVITDDQQPLQISLLLQMEDNHFFSSESYL